jgi:hypothetical protein
MNRLALIAFLTVPALTAACGEEPVLPLPALTIPSDPPPPPECDALDNESCAAGEKCTFVYLDPDSTYGKTKCVPDGLLAVGAECEVSSVGVADECVAGSFCLRGVCRDICTADPDDCIGDTLCSRFSSIFRDQTVDNVGLCTPLCDPVIQDCAIDEGCYLRDASGTAACSRVPTGALDRVQDQVCYGPGPNTCYLNGCARGFDTFLGITPLCMQFCTPAPTGLDPVNGDQLDGLRGDPGGIQCGVYDDSAGEAANTECRYFNGILNIDDGVYPPDSLGLCISESIRDAANLGSCTTHDLNTPYTQENVDNGTYVRGCESYLDQQGARWETPEAAAERGRLVIDAFTRVQESAL